MVRELVPVISYIAAPMCSFADTPTAHITTDTRNMKMFILLLLFDLLQMRSQLRFTLFLRSCQLLRSSRRFVFQLQLTLSAGEGCVDV